MSFTRILSILGLIAAIVASPTSSPGSSLERRAPSAPLLVGCYLGGPTACDCPADATGIPGILVNVFPGYQCAYPNGACSWSDITGALQNTAQENCPAYAPCPATGCACPLDRTGAQGVLINRFSGYQCAYLNAGVCTYDAYGNVQYADLTSGTATCPTAVACNASA